MIEILIIKWGRFVSLLQQDGLLKGLVSALSIAYENVRKSIILSKGAVLLVSDGVGDSVRYRTENVAEELTMHGISAAATIQGNPFLINIVDKFSIFVIHRVTETKTLEKFIKKIKEQGKTIIFETDDLVFDEKFFRFVEHFNHISDLEKKAYKGGIGASVINDPYVKVATMTTGFLAEQIKLKNKKVFIVPNKLSKNDVRISRQIYNKHRSHNKSDRIIRIGYFSGTRSHDKDFATIVDSMSHILDNNTNVLLYIAGPLELNSNFLKKYQKQIRFLPFVSRKKHFENITKVDINIVPLENNPFCEAKSELKFVEAGIMHVPTVAVANTTFSNAITNEVDGFLANNKADWIKYLQLLIDDEEFRNAVGHSAYDTIMNRYTTSNTNPDYINFLKRKIRDE